MTTAPADRADTDALLDALHTLDTRGTHPALGPELHHAIGVVLTGYRDLAEQHIARGEQLRTRCAALAAVRARLDEARASARAGWRRAARHARTEAAVRALLATNRRHVECVDVERALDGPTS